MDRGTALRDWSRSNPERVIKPERVNFGERALALLMLTASLPLMLVVALAVLLADGRPVFYKSRRLGRRKKTFTMYKFRTLVVGADRVTGSRLLDYSDCSYQELPIPGGKFLRDTRVDELPQLWNVLRGEMSFVGPRPERPEVYESQCRRIDGYELRFSVRPGVIGYSQLYTPHGTDKRYRTLIDNAGIRRRKSALHDLGLVLYTALVVLRRFAARGILHLREDVLCCKVLRLYQQKRRLRRIQRRDAVVVVIPTNADGTERRGRVVDINEEALLIEGAQGLDETMRSDIRLAIELPPNGHPGPRVRWAECQGYVTHRRATPSGPVFVLRYRPVNARSDYMLHQYFLQSSLAQPPKNHKHPEAGRAPVRAGVRDSTPDPELVC